MKLKLKSKNYYQLALGVAGIAALVLLIGFWRSFATPLPTGAAARLIAPPNGVSIGANFQVVAEFDLPLTASVTGLQMEAPAGLISGGEPELKLTYAWSSWHARVDAVMSCLQKPETPDGALVVNYTFGGKEYTARFTWSAGPVSPGDEPPGLAPEPVGEIMDTGVIESFWPVALAVVMVLGMLAWALYRLSRKKTLNSAPEISDRERALSALTQLEQEIKKGSVNLNLALDSLTDIVRTYLEARFQLPISRQTTAEFLADLHLHKAQLPVEQQPFLTDFMTAADLIKFAKAHLDEPMLLGALSGAAKLVEATAVTASANAAKLLPKER